MIKFFVLIWIILSAALNVGLALHFANWVPFTAYIFETSACYILLVRKSGLCALTILKGLIIAIAIALLSWAAGAAVAQSL